MRRLLPLVLLIGLAGCGGNDNPQPTPTVAATVATATVPPPAETTAIPPTETTAPGGGAGSPSVSLEAPRDGDEYLEGSDARADFKCRNAPDCRAAVAREGEPASPIEDGGKLPTGPGTYRFTVSAGEATASATYKVPDIPGNGGGDSQELPPGTPEGGP
jgi:hypothetical protein